MIPDQNGGCGASQLLRLFSAGISLDLHGRLLGQRANIGQRRRRSGRRRGRAEPLVTTPPLPGSPLALPVPRTPRDPRPPELGAGPRPLRSGQRPRRRAEAVSIPPALRPRPPASACALLPVRSCILSEVSTRSRSKLPAGKNVLLLGKCPPPRSAPPGSHPGQGPVALPARLCADCGPWPRPAARPAADSWGRRRTRTPARGPAGTRPFQSPSSPPGCGEALTTVPGKDRMR